MRQRSRKRMKLPLSRIAEFLQVNGEYDQEAIAHAYSIDSRTIQSGDLFFAVKGERLDGHDFVERALGRGAVAAVVRKDTIQKYPSKARLLAGDDTLLALQQLATQDWRRQATGWTPPGTFTGASPAPDAAFTWAA